MHAESPQDPLNVSLVALPTTAAGVFYGVYETLAAVGVLWSELTGQSAQARRMVPNIVSHTTRPFRSTSGATLTADASFDDPAQSDIVIVTDLDPDAAGGLIAGADAVEWLQRQYSGGALVCSVCTGSLMLAEAGLLDGLEATTHWAAIPMFEARFPQVRLHPERILLPAGAGHRIVTSGGSSAWSDLVLYLVARFSGHDEARRIAKIFLFGDRSDGQLPFATLARPRQHDDSMIAECQAWIAGHYDKPNPVAAMIARSGLAARTFARRFRKATGYAPIDYVQTLRIEEAKQLLEAGDEPIEEVAAAVGYDDAGSFRRLFKRLTGISPHRYRQRFQLPDISACVE
ncbi:MAG: helix-turn-helix domain-containing protein [Woeseiaceae bacterium]